MTKKGICIVVAYFICGYISAACWAGHFYWEWGGAGGDETNGTASRSAVVVFVSGPYGLPCALFLTDYPPMWDWPKHLFEYGGECGPNGYRCQSNQREKP